METEVAHRENNYLQRVYKKILNNLIQLLKNITMSNMAMRLNMYKYNNKMERN